MSGWHEQECVETWRWTERKFSAVFTDLASDTDHVLSLDFFLPEVIQNALGSLEIGGSINGHPLAPKSFARSGHYKYEQTVPESALIKRPVVVEFTLDKALPPGERDSRELGLVVASLRLS